MDFYTIVETSVGKGKVEVLPNFASYSSKDIMFRGRAFYALYNEETKLWSKDERDVGRFIDRDLKEYYNNMRTSSAIHVKYMNNYNDGMWSKYKKWVKESIDNFKPLDQKVIFSNMDVKKTDYASKKLPYPLEDGSIENYDRLVSRLYSVEERAKFEWAIGSIIAGDSKSIQKFFVFYGDPGSGKSTVLDIIKKLFDGYYSIFDAKSLGSSGDSFAMDFFENDPLLAIQEDGDLSRIEDNSKLNSIISHEEMRVNAKFKSPYVAKANCMLFMGTNHPIQITDNRSGLMRRLIIIQPTNERWSIGEYLDMYGKIDFELGAIAKHCLDVYNSRGKHFYDDYKPFDMLARTNPFYNFVYDNWEQFKDGVTLKRAYEVYKDYTEEFNYKTTVPKYKFRDELRTYFKKFTEQIKIDGEIYKNWFSELNYLKLGIAPMADVIEKAGEKVEGSQEPVENNELITWINMKEQPSIFDLVAKSYPAQLANEEGFPKRKWENNNVVLSQIDTHKLHYVKVPENHIVIDFDIKNEKGEKDFKANLIAASKFPKTYAEVSKSGAGIHLHYIYDGDVSKLSRVYDDEIEVKVYTGNSALRRKLSICNDIIITTINSGLPLKGDDKVINFKGIENEKHLRSLIKKGLNREVFPNTAPSIDFIGHVLEMADNDRLHYDVSNMKNAVLAFAAESTHQATACIRKVNKMKFKSDDIISDDPLPYPESEKNTPIIFFDLEVFKNLVILCYKYRGPDRSIVKIFNPEPEFVQSLCTGKLVGFNNRRYDNHILYAIMLGYTTEEIYEVSNKIINNKPGGLFSKAYNLSYTDIYDFASAANKMSLKKWEVKLKIHHQELGFPWDQPLPKEKWEKAAEYCGNDVMATEAVFDYLEHTDFSAREMLASISGGSVNDSTNSLTAKLIFGDDKTAQKDFLYTDLSDFFPGYEFKNGVSTYKGYEVGEGGFVWADPGMYGPCKVFDVASMHPHSMIAMKIFGEKYTKVLEDLVNARIHIKHKEYDKLKPLFDGKLLPYITDDASAKGVATALKTAINSIYGLTSAHFDNPFRDFRNIDNIVAKRGALFMINLKEEVEAKGYKVIHIKTDSIKVLNPDDYIANFIGDYGKKYGYTFEVEDEFKKICLVNKAVYIAQDYDNKWHATGLQFQVPYVYKTLFSKEPIEFDDLCEIKAVRTDMYLAMPNPSDPNDKVMQFIGKVGLLCPMKKGTGGGELVRDKGDQYLVAMDKWNKLTDEEKMKSKIPDRFASVTGAKGYEWMESEMVATLNKQDDIDLDYYRKLVDGAVETIEEFGSFEEFVTCDIPPYERMLPSIKSDELPF